MTFDSARDPIEQILEIASAAVYGPTGTTPAATRFKTEVRHFLDETNDIDAALAILIEVGEDLGLVTRDALGQFRPRKHRDDEDSAAAAGGVSTDGEEGQSTSAPLEAMDELPDSPSDNSAEGHVTIAPPGASTVLPEADATEGKDQTTIVAQATKVHVSDTSVAAQPAKSPSAADIAARAAARSRTAKTIEIFQRKLNNGRAVGGYRYAELHGAELEAKTDARTLRKIRQYCVPTDPSQKVEEYFPADVLAQILGKQRKVRRARKH